MHLLITLYYITWCIIFSYDIYTTMTLSIMTILLQWFYGISLVTNTSTNAFQYCIYCQKMTPQHFIHCNKCSKCVSADKVHSVKIGICLTKHHLLRYNYILNIINIYILSILLITSINYVYYLLAATLHLITIFYVFKETNIKRIEIC